jgi:diguanylate cyclase (GGDEF)-like protein/PAS domain S-box-containing protein
MDSATFEEGGYGGARVAGPLLLLAAIAVLDLALSDVTLLAWLAAAPLLASIVTTSRGTALTAAVAAGLAVALGVPHVIAGGSGHLAGVGIVLGAGALAVAIAWVRGEQELSVALASAARAEEAGELRAAMLRSALDCVICMDQMGRIVDFNEAAERTFGYTREEAIGRDLAELIVPPELRQAHREGLRRFVENGETRLIGQRVELTGMRADDTRFPVELAVSCVDGPHGPLLMGFLRDITERRRFQDELLQQALQDPLTSLPNRSLFMDRLELALRRRSRSPGRVAVFFIDFDRFKGVNDTYGHAAGDRLLTTAAQRWSGAIRPGDTLARVSGDEFTLVCEGLAGEDEVAAIAERLLQALAAPIQAGPYELRASASIGIAMAPDEGTSPDWILSVADGAMYQAKRRGGGRYSLLDGDAARWREARGQAQTPVNR